MSIDKQQAARIGRGVIKISLGCLVNDILQLPEAYHPVCAYYAHQPELVCVVIEHPQLPVPYANALPIVTPFYRVLPTTEGCVLRLSRVEAR